MRKPIIKKCVNCKIEFLCYRKEGKFCSRVCSGISSWNRERITFQEKFCLSLNIAPGVNNCWIWAKGKDRKGYGQFHYGKFGTYKAHRIVYEIFIGKIPPRFHVCHHCDNPGCVNPDHLWVGTNKDNMIDKMNKGRWKGNTGKR